MQPQQLVNGQAGDGKNPGDIKRPSFINNNDVGGRSDFSEAIGKYILLFPMIVTEFYWQYNPQAYEKWESFIGNLPFNKNNPVM